MNNFNITIVSETFYPQSNYGAPVMIIDEIKLEPKTVSTPIAAQATMNVLKDIAAKQLSKAIIESMSHTSISDKQTNTYCDRFSFTYAEKDELDILKQQLESRTEQYLSTCESLNEAHENIKYITDKYMKAQKQVKFQYVVIILSASIVSFIISTLGAN